MGRVKHFKSYFKGTITLNEQEIKVDAIADEYHDPGCMYKRNGDPGDPPEDSFEIIKCDPDTDEVHEYLEEHPELFEPGEEPEW